MDTLLAVLEKVDERLADLAPDSMRYAIEWDYRAALWSQLSATLQREGVSLGE